MARRASRPPGELTCRRDDAAFDHRNAAGVTGRTAGNRPGRYLLTPRPVQTFPPSAASGSSASSKGSVHLTAARSHGIIDALTSADVMTFADKGYQGARGSVRTPFKRRRFRPKLSRRQRAVNRAHARIRARGERAIATLKTWKTLAKLRCCTRRATAIAQAILVLHHVEANRYAR
ncbi:DDE superfamily endonuclease [Micromonospora cremea]|uniref:DDE superfamily endonuclease n=1 Tax=Micromonospora cremea TaxID=709881 RepID=A0A1N5TSG5_9ACTN|nr:DDE superfamily endonuclease [Micromonospora cremea]